MAAKTRGSNLHHHHLLVRLLTLVSLFALRTSASTARAPVEPRYRAMFEEYRKTHQRLLIIMLDGFRHDYLRHEGYEFPGFRKVLQRGASPEHLVPDFPTLSYPNYYSLMTGLHTEQHGMTGNYMYDVKRKESFLIGSNPDQLNSHWWESGEPLWVTAEKQNRTTSLYYWPGCDVEIAGRRPTHCKPYRGPPSMDDFREAIIGSLRQLQFREADVVGIYFEQIDSLGHQFGPGSKRLMEIITDLDPIMGYLADSLATFTLSDVNLMIVSDHGMTSVSHKRVIDLNKVLKPADYEMIFTDAAVANVYATPGKKHEVFRKLKDFHPHLRVYRQSHLPGRWRYKHGRHVSPVTAVADLGWFILGPDKREFPLRQEDGLPMAGWHGFDNNNQDMMGVFIGMGPGFRHNVTSPPIHIVDLYQIMCHVLEITPSRNSGSWSRVSGLVTFDVCSDASSSDIMTMTTKLTLLTSLALFWILRSWL